MRSNSCGMIGAKHCWPENAPSPRRERKQGLPKRIIRGSATKGRTGPRFRISMSLPVNWPMKSQNWAWGIPITRRDFAARLWEILGEGKQNLPPRHDPRVIAEAVSLVKSGAGIAAEVADDVVPFRKLGTPARYRRFLRDLALLRRSERYAAFNESEHPRDDDGRFVTKGTAATGFASANTRTGLDFASAKRQLAYSPRHRRLKRIFAEIDRAVGLPAEAHDAIGDWGGTAEASVVTTYKGLGDIGHVLYAMAHKGLAAQQAAVLTFEVQRGGPHSLWQLDSEFTVEEARRRLENAGIHRAAVAEREVRGDLSQGPRHGSQCERGADVVVRPVHAPATAPDPGLSHALRGLHGL